jgi:hypothetical protein
MAPISMSIEGDVVVNRVSATSTVEDIAEHIRAHVLSWKACDELWDLSEPHFENIASAELKNCSAQVERLSESRTGKRAAIIINDNLGFGMMRMFEGISEMKITQEPRVFKDEPRAREGLNSSADSVEID